MLKGQYTEAERTSKRIALKKIFHFWDGVLVLKGQHTEAERTSKRIALKKYFTLGRCFGTERSVHTRRENKQEKSFEKYST